MNQKIKRLLPEEHMTIAGKTRSGKSHGASLLHDLEDVKSVYFNAPQKKEDDTEISGIEASHRSDFNDIVKVLNGGESVQYITHWKTKVMEEELKMVYEACKEANGEVYLFVDEAHLFNDGLTYAVRDGLGHGVHVLPISQQVKDFNDAVRENIEEHMIFKISISQKGWFDYYNMPFDSIQEWTNNDYHFCIYDMEQLEKHKPLPPP